MLHHSQEVDLFRFGGEDDDDSSVLVEEDGGDNRNHCQSRYLSKKPGGRGMIARIKLPIATHVRCPNKMWRLRKMGTVMGHPLADISYRTSSQNKLHRPVQRYARNNRIRETKKETRKRAHAAPSSEEGNFQGSSVRFLSIDCFLATAHHHTNRAHPTKLSQPTLNRPPGRISRC